MIVPTGFITCSALYNTKVQKYCQNEAKAHMKNARQPKKEDDALEIQEGEFRNPEQIIKKLIEVQKELIDELEQARAGAHAGHHQGLESALGIIVTNAWKARAKMMDVNTGEPREDMRRVYRHIETMFVAIHTRGFQVKVQTGDHFDYGMPLALISTQPTPGIAKERVIETIKPTIYWNETIIQAGEVVIATPVEPQRP